MEGIYIQEAQQTMSQLSPEQLELLLESIESISMGIQFLTYMAAAFFVWKVITILYKLFGEVFFGGV